MLPRVRRAFGVALVVAGLFSADAARAETLIDNVKLKLSNQELADLKAGKIVYQTVQEQGLQMVVQVIPGGKLGYTAYQYIVAPGQSVNELSKSLRAGYYVGGNGQKVAVPTSRPRASPSDDGSFVDPTTGKPVEAPPPPPTVKKTPEMTAAERSMAELASQASTLRALTGAQNSVAEQASTAEAARQAAEKARGLADSAQKAADDARERANLAVAGAAGKPTHTPEGEALRAHIKELLGKAWLAQQAADDAHTLAAKALVAAGEKAWREKLAKRDADPSTTNKKQLALARAELDKAQAALASSIETKREVSRDRLYGLKAKPTQANEPTVTPSAPSAPNAPNARPTLDEQQKTLGSLKAQEAALGPKVAELTKPLGPQFQQALTQARLASMNMPPAQQAEFLKSQLRQFFLQAYKDPKLADGKLHEFVDVYLQHATIAAQIISLEAAIKRGG